MKWLKSDSLSDQWEIIVLILEKKEKRERGEHALVRVLVWVCGWDLGELESTKLKSDLGIGSASKNVSICN